MPSLRSRAGPVGQVSTNLLPSIPVSPVASQSRARSSLVALSLISSLSIEDIATVSPALAVVTCIQRAFDGCGELPSANVVFNTVELRDLILNSCDHFTVMAVSRASRTGRVAAQDEIRSRIRTLVSQFVSADRLTSFIDMLEVTGAVVVGSVARQLFMVNSLYLEDLPDWQYSHHVGTGDLNIVAPVGRADQCRAWFSADGYKCWPEKKDRVPAHGYIRVASSFETGKKKMTGSQYAQVTITESRNSVIPVVLASTYTAQANAISTSSLYCFYPNLATALPSLRSDLAGTHLFRRASGPFSISTSNKDWKLRCGPFCPARYRKTSSDRLVATFRWNGTKSLPESRRAGVDYLVAERTVKWRFSRACRNRLCENYTADHRRRRMN